MSVWDRIVGQDRAVALLRQDLTAGRVAHAYLFAGMAGAAMRDAAVAFAAALQCETGGCGACETCVRVVKLAHPDVDVVEPPGMQLLVDQVREAIREAWRRPTGGRRRVIVMDQADRMNPNAQNAFLKALEEPPASTVIVLVAEGPEALLETVRSRCREILFRPLSETEVAASLEHDGVSSAQARAWARIGGSLHRARELARDDASRERRKALAERVLRVPRDAGDALESADWLAQQTRHIRDRVAASQRAEAEELADWLNETRAAAEARTRREQRRAEQDALAGVLDDVTSVLRDVLVCQLDGGDDLLNDDLAAPIRARGSSLGRERVAAVLGALGDVDDARRRLRANANVLLTLEAMFLAIGDRLA